MVALAGNQPANRENKLLPKFSSSVSTLLVPLSYFALHIVVCFMLCHSDLFRISYFEFRIFYLVLVWFQLVHQGAYCTTHPCSREKRQSF
jgi:hypothetical protein